MMVVIMIFFVADDGVVDESKDDNI